MTLEPKFNRVPGHTRINNGRWLWYYPAIADWMLENPGKTFKECAAHLHRHPYTISAIVNSDMFQEYFRQRREEWTRNHDLNISQKMTKVAEAALDVMLEKLERQADKLPMQFVNSVATDTLDRLGYAPKSVSPVQVNVDQSHNTQQVVITSIDASALAEARDALRTAEQQRATVRREGLIIGPDGPMIEEGESGDKPEI